MTDITKEIKSKFFVGLNNMILDRNDNLKYLILAWNEKKKEKMRVKKFRFWKLVLSENLTKETKNVEKGAKNCGKRDVENIGEKAWRIRMMKVMKIWVES